jgi:hypothetical protein
MIAGAIGGAAEARVDEYDIYIRAFASGQGEPPEVGLHRVFGLEQRRAFELVQSLPRTVKRHVPAQHIARYERALRELGADFELRPSPIRPAQIIAVRGPTDAEEAERLQQHGSTLTLPPPNAMPVARPTAVRAATMIGTAAQLSAERALLDVNDTVVDPVPAGAQAHLPEAELAAANLQPAVTVARGNPFASEAPGPASVPARASAATLNEVRPSNPHASAASHAPAVVRDPAPPARELPLERLAREAPPLQWSPPAEVRAPARAVAPGAPVSVPAGPWSAIDPVVPVAAQQGELPPPSAVPGLQLGGRPGWLVEGPSAFQPEVISDAAPEPAAGQSELAVQSVGAAMSARPARPVSARAPASTYQVGTIAGLEVERSEPPALLRVLLRVGIGVSLFLIFATLRHCRMFERDVDKALAHWEEPAASSEPGASKSAHAADWAGPVATEWMATDLHQFSNGDKDKVQDLVRRFLRAGAIEVRVGHISHSGLVQIGAELLVQLPDDGAKRKAVLAEYERFLDSTFGGMAAPPKDPGGDTLRVAL